MLSENAVAQGGLMVICTLLGGLGTKLIEMLGARDKLKYDKRLTELEDSVKECKEKHKECEDAHGASIAQIEALRKEMRDRDEQDRRTLRAEIEELRQERNTQTGG